MSELIGVYSLDDTFSEHMSLTMHPDSFPVRWSLCNLTANFMADYFAELFPETDQEERLLSRQEISGAVSYVLNELVENAVKFNQNGDINVTVGIGTEDLVCVVSNQIMGNSAPKLRERLSELANEDPGELLRRQAEANAEDSDSDSAGLGYLIIMNDYGVTLGWKLDAVSANTVCVRTMARLPILKERARMEVKGVNYRVWYNPVEVLVSFEGILRLGGPQEYQPIEDLLDKVLLSEPKVITLDLRALSFLNSSGISVLYKFAIAMRKRGDLQLVVRGSKNVPWQGKSLPNLKKFNSNFEMILCD